MPSLWLKEESLSRHTEHAVSLGLSIPRAATHAHSQHNSDLDGLTTVAQVQSHVSVYNVELLMHSAPVWGTTSWLIVMCPTT